MNILQVVNLKFNIRVQSFRYLQNQLENKKKKKKLETDSTYVARVSRCF